MTFYIMFFPTHNSVSLAWLANAISARLARSNIKRQLDHFISCLVITFFFCKLLFCIIKVSVYLNPVYDY